MSAVPPIASQFCHRSERRQVPRTDSCAATKTSAWPLPPAREAHVAYYPSCQRNVPKSTSTMEISMMTTRKSFAMSVATTILMLLTVASMARAGTEDEVKALFGKFVTAQNAHDL